MNIAVVGVGLIGGSFALAIRRRRFDIEVMGVDRNDDNLQEALDLGIIDSKGTLEDAISWADLILLAIPVDGVLKMLPGLLDQAREGQLIVDFGSTKSPICKAIDSHPNRSHFLASHPMAGTEYSGPSAAFSTLFEDKVMVLVEEDKTNPGLLLSFKEICKNLAMRMTFMNALDHDRHIAYVSHLSHVTSFALSHTVLDIEKDERSIFEMAGSGFASTVRLAKSSPAMWKPIFEQNKDNLDVAVQSYLEHMQHFSKLLKEEDYEGIKSYMEEANKIRGIIDQIERKQKR